MPVVEYKMTIKENGKLEVPGYITDRGYWSNPTDKTLVGWVKPESEREYWVPDTLVELTKAEFKTRLLAMHAVEPFTTDADHSVNMTTEEVGTMADDWYDAFVTNNS